MRKFASDNPSAIMASICTAYYGNIAEEELKNKVARGLLRRPTHRPIGAERNGAAALGDKKLHFIY